MSKDDCQSCHRNEVECGCEHFLHHPSKLAEAMRQALADGYAIDVVTVDPQSGQQKVIASSDRSIQ